jgi:hypothetical protein
MPATAALPDRWSKRIARLLLAEWEARGGPLARFARERGVRTDRLRWWQKRLAAEERARRPRVRGTAAAPLTFVPAIATAPTSTRAGGADRVIVRLTGGVEVEATSVELLSPSWLGALARAVVSGG